MRCRAFLFILLLGIAAAIFAVEPDEILSDPALEARARVLSSELRCVQCQSESIDASSAQVARDLRILLREKLVEGMSDQEIKDYLSARYGDFILLKPRYSGSSLLLWWFGPLMLLISGVLVFNFILNSAVIEDDDA